ncbi:molybdopterin oxidoreductase family protein [Cellulomonas marina]|uniref:Molydopterin dinucleotide binding domain-containing protein n=1 Tax=Cellulomonas marina TaxID=988821 RepID=A0A1I0WC04_9CELL|nr:nitrate reductase [Cellulomonas marina]GIG29064.1 molybdopterin oxidoreductase [Cellulomonas marina]SFA85740.1 Molydopterin dinucleotide binding domain-containing protein [Cellulomonas marina]
MARTDRIAEPWGTRTPYGPGERWPVRVDQHLEEGLTEADVDRWVQSASTLHSNGDGLDLAVKDGRLVGVRGRAQDRVNHGRLGPKDLFGWQSVGSSDRLTQPLVGRDGRLVETTWDEAMELLVGRMQELLAERGASAVGFYTTGQLFLEEYYTLGVMAHAGIGTNHVDGNTRLCTATAAAALKESFGCDGQPGSYTDVDHADVIALFGHNMAETQTVLWTRILDRLAGPRPPQVLCVDPRLTPVARAATVHLAPRPGTNVALMNGLLHEVIAHGWVDEDYVAAHTVGFSELERQVREYTPEVVARICDVPEEDLRAAARLVGTADRLLSTVLQGFYQSHQGTASAVQVNNLHLVRGMLGAPGRGLLQMNGQPSAENTRECGADGDLAGFRNWSNAAHVADLARVWNVEPDAIPHWSPPTHAMQMMRYLEDGSMRMLWVQGTNPLVSLPELNRIRSVLTQERVFLVVQDIFLSETAQVADLVLPAATTGEKTGTFTNVDRTVHLSEKAVEPPGQARPDLDIFLDFARRMGFRDKDGGPLVHWHDPESAFAVWKECSRGRPCDYTALTYDKLRGGSGIQWPCDEEHPEGTERLYEGGRFFAAPDVAESYGRDLITGAPLEETEYRAMNPQGRAVLKAARYVPPHELPSERFPLQLVTGRTLYHFHTRTRTGRARQLHDAAPDVWVEVSQHDAGTHGLAEGDLAEVTTPRGRVEGRVRISGIRPGVLFLPFHYGYWDMPGGHAPDGHSRAANELTLTDWDPCSKQPVFKTAAARLRRLAASDGTPSPAPTTTGSAPVGPGAASVPPTRGGEASMSDELLPSDDLPTDDLPSDGGAR